MSIALDHTIVPARDRHQAAAFFAGVFGLDAASDIGPFAAVRVNESLTLDFLDGHGFEQHHYAFRVDDAEFDAIFGRLADAGIMYGSGPFSLDDMQINRRRGGRGVYFRDPDGHVLELLTRT